MFRLSTATTHYGNSSYPLYGLERSHETIENLDNLNLTELSESVASLTGFYREFTKTHCVRMEFTKETHRVDLVIPERIVAIANGYTVTWVKDVE